jgi:hypothetical protein
MVPATLPIPQQNPAHTTRPSFRAGHRAGHRPGARESQGAPGRARRAAISGGAAVGLPVPHPLRGPTAGGQDAVTATVTSA